MTLSDTQGFGRRQSDPGLATLGDIDFPIVAAYNGSKWSTRTPCVPRAHHPADNQEKPRVSTRTARRSRHPMATYPSHPILVFGTHN